MNHRNSPENKHIIDYIIVELITATIYPTLITGTE